MTKNKNRKRKIQSRMKSDGINYVRAHNAVTGKTPGGDCLSYAPLKGLIDFLKENDDFGPGRLKEVRILHNMMRYADQNEISEPDTISPSQEGGMEIIWHREGKEVIFGIDAKTGVSLYCFGPESDDTVILYGMDGDDLTKVYDLMLKYLKGVEPEKSEADASWDALMKQAREEHPNAEPSNEAMEGFLRKVFGIKPKEPSEWELRLQSLADAHLENIMIEPVSKSAQDLTHQLLSKAERLGIKIPKIDALKGGGIELLWEEGEREVGVEIDAKGYSFLWDGILGDDDDYFESKTVGLPSEIQKLIEGHAPINLIEGYTFRQWNGAYSDQHKFGKSLLS